MGEQVVFPLVLLHPQIVQTQAIQVEQVVQMERCVDYVQVWDGVKLAKGKDGITIHLILQKKFSVPIAITMMENVLLVVELDISKVANEIT